MARSTFYYLINQMRKPDKYSYIKDQIKEIFHSNKGRYGYRRITLELKNRSIFLNHKTVLRLMNSEGIKCQVRIKKYRSYKGNNGSIASNILSRNFKSAVPNAKWATDITEFSMFGQKRYLSPIMDLYNGEIISYTISERPNLEMVINMLKQALIIKDKEQPLILHSDQGWHYQHAHYQKLLLDNSIIQSMSRKGNCLDNASMENFFGLLKSELLYLQKFNSINEFEEELKNYIYYYNNERIKVKLKGLSPVMFRTQSL